MAKTREIKGRMKAVGNIQRITKTMQMIATARFQAALKRATASKPYSRKIAELVGELAAAAGAVEHPLLRSPTPPANRRLVLVISSNRGLCGGYNANVLRTAAQRLRDHAGTQVELQVVGKKALGYFKFAGRPVDVNHAQFGDEPKYVDVERLAQSYIEQFTQGKYDSIEVVSMAFESTSRQSPKVLTLLPLQPPAASAGGAAAQAVVEYDYSPEPEVLLGELLPATVKVQLFQCFNEAVVTEQVSRMVAMKAATDAAGKMKKSLHRRYNRARQTAITTELTEIISGSAALE
jgi:F-type H+-transporting ATPase subunit gamma